MVSQRGGDKTCLATFAERKMRQYMAIKIPNRTSEAMNKAIAQAMSKYPAGTFLSFTCDNGKEFSGFKEIEERFKILVYFAHPYASWERGTNENHNGLLREFFSKKTNFKDISVKELNNAVQLINKRPRKVLDFKSAQEDFDENISHLI